jgi:AraC-like DNA-binding protein
MRLSATEYFHTEGQSVVIEPRAPQAPFPLHDHDFNEIFVVLSGNGWHYFNDRPHFITCGEVFYVRADDRHEFYDLDDLHLINILYRLESCSLRPEVMAYLLDASASPDGERRHWQINEDTLAQVRATIDRMGKEIAQGDRMSRIMAETLFAQLSILLHRNRFATDAEELPQGMRLSHVLNYLRQNCSQEIDLDDLARRFGYSPRSFNRVFREATATTPHTYLVKLRICEAMRALRQTGDSITDIAFAAGFNDSNYFSYAFNKLTGMSPSEYRRRAHAG